MVNRVAPLMFCSGSARQLLATWR